MRLKNGRNRGNRNILAVFAAIAILLISTISRADIVTINIQAIVDKVDDPFLFLQGKIQRGSIITGYYTYDSSVVDSYPAEPMTGRYSFFYPLSESKPFGIFLNSGGLSFQTGYGDSTGFRIDIFNDLPPDIFIGSPPYIHDIYLIFGLGASSLNNYPLNIGWTLYYPAFVLNSDNLPTTAPSLENLWDNILTINHAGYDIEAHVISAVPEPATILIFSMGILGIFFRKEKKI